MFTENFNDSNNQIDSFECVTFFALLGNIDLAENWIAKDQVRLYNEYKMSTDKMSTRNFWELNGKK